MLGAAFRVPSIGDVISPTEKHPGPAHEVCEWVGGMAILYARTLDTSVLSHRHHYTAK